MNKIIVLQTEEDAKAFIAQTEGRTGRRLASFLGLKGRGSVILADELLVYASSLIRYQRAFIDAELKAYSNACIASLEKVGRCRARFQVGVMVNTSDFNR